MAVRTPSQTPAANNGSVKSGLAYNMVLLLKKFLLTIKRGEQIVEAQRQALAVLPEFEPHAAF